MLVLALPTVIVPLDPVLRVMALEPPLMTMLLLALVDCNVSERTGVVDGAFGGDVASRGHVY